MHSDILRRARSEAMINFENKFPLSRFGFDARKVLLHLNIPLHRMLIKLLYNFISNRQLKSQTEIQCFSISSDTNHPRLILVLVLDFTDELWFSEVQ